MHVKQSNLFYICFFGMSLNLNAHHPPPQKKKKQSSGHIRTTFLSRLERNSVTERVTLICEETLRDIVSPRIFFAGTTSVFTGQREDDGGSLCNLGYCCISTLVDILVA